jgi:hypothetical protein
MREKAATKQYTIRGIPREVHRLLRQKAARQKRSPNQVVVDELTAATVAFRRRTDLSDITSGWVPDPAFDDILASQRQFDWAKWK